MSTTDSFILHESAKKYEWTGESFLSIKSFYSGNAEYEIGSRQYNVSENNFLILNECTRYKIRIDTKTPTESFCLFLSPEFVSKNIERDVLIDSDLLFKNTTDRLDGGFFERNYSHQGELSKLLLDGKACAISSAKGLEKEEYFQRILMALYNQNNKSSSESNILFAKKKSTREEIYRRIFYAKDFIDCNYHKDINLECIASVSCLSSNHLIRNFKVILGMTPFQYITRLKISHAVGEIRTTMKSITEIANDLGYSSLGNFSYYFKSVVGIYPTELRKDINHHDRKIKFFG